MIFSPHPARKNRLQLRISERRILLRIGDLMAITVAVLLALWVWSQVADYRYDLGFILPRLYWLPILALLWIVLAEVNDYYNLSVAADFGQSFRRLALITGQLILIYVVMFFLSERNALPRLFILYYGLASVGMLLLSRWLNPALIGWASEKRRVLVVGSDWAAQTIIETVRDYAPDAYDIVGIIGMAKDIGNKLADVPVIGEGSDLVNYVTRDDITELIVTSTRELSGDIFAGVMDAYERGVVITPMPILYERLTDRVPVEHVGESWAVVLPLSGVSVFNPYPFLKRMLDLMVASIGMVFFLLLLPIIAVLIYMDSPGQIFYPQTRVGLNGRRFTVYKLRTMIPNAEKATGAVFAQENDPRITRMGRFMRKTRLDEVPQLWNVLRGDMSMVGPRPERPEHIERLQAKIPFYRTRHVIRPGVTGWAQVRYKYGSTDEDSLIKLQYDLYYIRHQSILLDIGILLRTIGKVLKMSGT